MTKLFYLSFTFLVCLSFTTSKVNPVTIQLEKSITNTFKEGDLILKQGDGPLSYHIMNATKEKYTHCGVLYKKENSWYVIHTVGGGNNHQKAEGIQSTPLHQFTNHTADSMLYVCRAIFTKNAGEEIVKRAQYYLKQKIPFDYRFSLLSEDKFYCSELLYHIFKDINNDKNVFVIQKKHKAFLLMFSTFFKPAHFKKVYQLKTKI